MRRPQGGDSGRVTDLANSPADFVQGAQGGSGLAAFGLPTSATSLTAAGGSFRGGRGGNAGGTANQQIDGGVGGTGLYGNALTVTISGGTFTGAGGTAGGTAPTVAGGQGGYGARIDSSRDAVITGGLFQGGDGGTTGGGSKPVGGIGRTGGPGLFVTNSTVSVYGGSFKNGADLNPGGTYDDVLGGYNSVITFYGSGFSFNGVQNFYGVLNPTGPAGGSFSGLLADNAAPATYTFNAQGATFVLAPAPEPSAFAGLAMGALGLAGLGLNARRRRTAA